MGFGIGTFTQINGITSAVKRFFDPELTWTVELFGRTYSWTVVISGTILTLCVALVIIGGIKRISISSTGGRSFYGTDLCSCSTDHTYLPILEQYREQL